MAIRTIYPKPWTPPPFRPTTGRTTTSGPATGTGPAAAGAPPLIGNVFVTINPLNGRAQVGELVTITGYRAGGNAPLTISWTGPPGSSAPLNSTSNVISWIVQAGDSGTYTATAISAGAADSPKSAGTVLTVMVTIGTVTITPTTTP